MIFVTGATGMVGANLIALFERNNVEYKALKRKSSTLNIVKNVFKIQGIENKIQNIKWVEGDVYIAQIYERSRLFFSNIRKSMV